MLAEILYCSSYRRIHIKREPLKKWLYPIGSIFLVKIEKKKTFCDHVYLVNDF